MSIRSAGAGSLRAEIGALAPVSRFAGLDAVERIIALSALEVVLLCQRFESVRPAARSQITWLGEVPGNVHHKIRVLHYGVFTVMTSAGTRCQPRSYAASAPCRCAWRAG